MRLKQTDSLKRSDKVAKHLTTNTNKTVGRKKGSDFQLLYD